MDLHVTLACAPPRTPAPREIVVDTDVLSTGAALAESLEAAGYATPLTVCGVPLATLMPHVDELHNGAVIVAGGIAGTEARSSMPHLLFVVHSGPDAGTVSPLTRGTYAIGRTDSDITVADPALSRRHALLTVTEDAIGLEDLGSANGTFVDGRTITATTITTSSTVRLGSSDCRVELMDDQGGPASDPGGILDPLTVTSDLPRKPSRILLLTALLPLGLGVVLALTTGMWFFLAFSGLSAVTGLVPLLSYRRNTRVFARDVEQAAQQDRIRRTTATPDPGRVAVDVFRAAYGPLGQPVPDAPPPHMVRLRIGTADQDANLTVRGDDGSFVPPPLPGVPLVACCDAEAGTAGQRSLTITGDAERVMDLARALLLQTAHPDGGRPHVICSGSPRDIPPPARFLPNVHVSADAGLLTCRAETSGVTLVFHFGEEPVDVSGATGVFLVRIITAPRHRSAGATGTTAASARVILEGGRAWASIDGTERSFHPDGVASGTFDRVARTLARAAARTPAPTAPQGHGIARGVRDIPPESASLWSGGNALGSLTSAAKERWASSVAEQPIALLGATGEGPLFFDLVADGPHLLVAGTTGSGKSEFLRTLVLGLAVNQPPDHLTLLLIDYKGGSGLGHLAALPHCVGSLSDLSLESTGRAFVSLRAELRHRELLCADHGAHDLAHLRLLAPSSCPPRLVVVIDEFRMLCEDVPSALPDLLKIASLGRSLGVHLVLATQRAQGAVTPDLRANITSAVVLRVQTTMESQDLLGSARAAEIPVDRPGRAYLRRGAEQPTAFQVAACSSVPPANDVPGWQDFLSAEQSLRKRGRAGPAGPGGEELGTSRAGAGGAERSVLADAVEALRAVGRGTAGREPRRPVLPPLPAELSPAECSAFPSACSSSPGSDLRPAAYGGQALALGIADFPDRQEQRVLQWLPDSHSHLALIGLPGSGADAALRAIVSALPQADSDLHLYLLDGDGSLEGIPRGFHIGAHVQSHEARRAERVLERLVERRGREEDHVPHIVLVITGWGRWTGQFRNSRTAAGEEDLHMLVRDGARNGVTVLIAGDRDVTTSRFFPLVPNRIYLPLDAHQDTTMTWPRLPPLDPVAGRGLAQGPITGSWGDGVCQLVLGRPLGPPSKPPSVPPFPVHALPRVVRLADLGIVPAVLPRQSLPLGVHGDNLLPYEVRLRAGEVFLVLGHQSSGRTNALRVVNDSAGLFQRHRRILAPPCLSDSTDGDPAGTQRPEAACFWRELTTRDSFSSLEQSILLVDDADGLPQDVQQILSGLVAGGAAAVLAATPGPALIARVPLSLQARASGRGFILSPRSALDGDFFGVRLDAGGAPPPGRGYAMEPGRVIEVQLAHAVAGLSTGPGRGTTGGATAFSRLPS